MNASSQQKPSRLPIVSILIVALAVFWLLSLFLPAATSQPGATRTTCRNNLKQLSMALQNYSEHFGCFPPAFLPDANGQPMHSWRVLILPYIEERAAYAAYNFRSPWNHPSNSTITSSRILNYCCPNSTTPNATSYLAVVGQHTVWPNSMCRRPQAVKAPSATWQLVETTNSDVPWAEPRDLNIDEMSADRFGDLRTRLEAHTRSFHAAMVNGDARAFRTDISYADFMRSVIITGGDEADPNQQRTGR